MSLARVVAMANTDREADGGEQTVAQIRKHGGHGQFIRGDVSIATDIERAIAAAAKAKGHIDYAFLGCA